MKKLLCLLAVVLVGCTHSPTEPTEMSPIVVTGSCYALGGPFNNSFSVTAKRPLNTSDYPLTYEYRQNGTLIATGTVPNLSVNWSYGVPKVAGTYEFSVKWHSITTSDKIICGNDPNPHDW